MFQSRSGFLPHRDAAAPIASRPLDECFNPVLGFYRIATVLGLLHGNNVVVFQSRSGFLPHRDSPDAVVPSPSAPCFNPVLGFYRIATPRSAGDESRLGVSIPFWVSTASRQSCGSCEPMTTFSFNPVLGFYRIATRHSRSRRCTQRCFNPVLGFYRIATTRLGGQHNAAGTVSIPFWVSTASRHAAVAVGPREPREVSIPFWVSTASRRGVTETEHRQVMEFQSRSGFLPHRDAKDDLDEDLIAKFQSRSGFLPHRDVTARTP